MLGYLLSVFHCSGNHVRAADLDWIVGPRYSLGRVHSGVPKGGRAGISKNVTKGGSQLTWEGGRAGISKNVTDTKRDRRGVTTDLRGGQGRNKQKRYRHKT